MARHSVKMRIFTLTRGPGEGPSAQYVDVNVEDALAGAGAVIHDQTEVISVPGVLRDLRGGEHELPGQRLVVEVAEALDVPARDDEHVQGRTRVQVLEGDDVGILVDDRRGHLFRGDLAEDAVGHLGTLPSWSTRSPSRSLILPPRSPSRIGSRARKASICERPGRASSADPISRTRSHRC